MSGEPITWTTVAWALGVSHGAWGLFWLIGLVAYGASRLRNWVLGLILCAVILGVGYFIYVGVRDL